MAVTLRGLQKPLRRTESGLSACFTLTDKFCLKTALALINKAQRAIIFNNLRRLLSGVRWPLTTVSSFFSGHGCATALSATVGHHHDTDRQSERYSHLA